MEKKDILEVIQQHYGFKQKTEFAEHLGIHVQVLYNWIKRNSFNTQTLLEKCPDINPNFILTGIGDVEMKIAKAQIVNEDNSLKDVIIEELRAHIETLKGQNLSLLQNCEDLRQLNSLLQQQNKLNNIDLERLSAILDNEVKIVASRNSISEIATKEQQKVG